VTAELIAPPMKTVLMYTVLMRARAVGRSA